MKILVSGIEYLPVSYVLVKEAPEVLPLFLVAHQNLIVFNWKLCSSLTLPHSSPPPLSVPWDPSPQSSHSRPCSSPKGVSSPSSQLLKTWSLDLPDVFSPAFLRVNQELFPSVLLYSVYKTWVYNSTGFDLLHRWTDPLPGIFKILIKCMATPATKDTTHFCCRTLKKIKLEQIWELLTCWLIS